MYNAHDRHSKHKAVVYKKMQCFINYSLIMHTVTPFLF